MAKQKPRSSRKPKRTRSISTFDPTRLREDVDTYTDAIYAVLALINHARWDEKAKKLQDHVKFGIGRRFSTSSAHPTHPDMTVTPDGSVQFSAALGVVAEAKPGVARDPAVWEENLNQLKKYDHTLLGWWTKDEKVESHDIVALMPLSRVVEFADLVKAKQDAGSVTFDRPLAVVGFTKQTGAEHVWVVLKTESGSVTDPTLRERLRKAVPVNWQKILVHYNDVRFIDNEPPVPYTLFVLWDFMFPKLVEGREREEGKPWIGIDVEVESLTSEVQKYYGLHSDGPHAIEVPRQKWIRRALDALVVFGLAERVVAGKSYKVRYRRHRTKEKDTLALFGRYEFQHRERLAMLESYKPLIAAAEGTPSSGAAASKANVETV